MRGADGVRDALAHFLLDALPLKTAALRAAWNLDQGRLPDMGAVTSGEMTEEALTDVADAWCEIVNPRMLAGMRWVDITDAGDPVFHTRYACKLYVWALGVNWDQSIIRRDMLALAVRTCLLEFPTLTLAGGDTEYVALQETWSEEYGVPTRAPNDSGRTWCSAVLSVDVRAEESLAAGRLREPIAQAARVVLGADGVGPHSEFPPDLPTPDQFSPAGTVGTSTGG